MSVAGGYGTENGTVTADRTGGAGNGAGGGGGKVGGIAMVVGQRLRRGLMLGYVEEIVSSVGGQGGCGWMIVEVRVIRLLSGLLFLM